MIPWLIHTSTNRLLHQGAALWLWDQCRQRDKVLLQVGRLIEEEIDSWWWSGGWCIIVIVAMLPLSLLQCCQNCCIHGKQNWLAFQSPASTSATPPPRLRMDQPSYCWSYSKSVILLCIYETLTSSADLRCKELETQFPVILAFTCLPLSWKNVISCSLLWSQ